MQGIKSHINGGLIRTNQKGNCGGLLRYLKTWFQPNGLGNILSFGEVDKLSVIKYYHKEKTFVVQTKAEENEEGEVYFHKRPEGFPFVYL